MDPKGIELPGIGPPMLNISRIEPKQVVAIQPVSGAEKASFRKIGTDRSFSKEISVNQNNINNLHEQQQEAKEAVEILKEHLSDQDHLEISWHFESKFGELVVEIKDKNTGKVLRQIPPKDILLAALEPNFDPTGLLLNKTA